MDEAPAPLQDSLHRLVRLDPSFLLEDGAGPL
jgi:hypothetical protein